MEQAEFFSERAALYQLLARLYMYPLSSEVLSLLAGLSFEEDPAEEYRPLFEGLAVMQRVVASAEDLSTLVEMLNREATRLFEGPGQPLAPPYGSYYLNRKRLMGPEAIAVQKAYLTMAMIPNADVHQSPDHLTLELGFLAALAANPRPDTVNQMRHFIAKHIVSWLPAWKDDVLAAKPHPFFVGLVNFTHVTLAEDLAWLNEYDSIVSPVVAGDLEV